METCGFCEKPCGYDWCSTKVVTKEEEKEYADMDMTMPCGPYGDEG